MTDLTRQITEATAPSDIAAEGSLKRLLARSLRKDLTATLGLVRAALKSEHIRNKEYLVEVIEDVEDRRVIPVLMLAVTADTSVGDMAGYAREKALRALGLLEAREAAPLAMRHLADPVERVRNMALRFCLDLDIREAAPLFVDRLGPDQEDDTDMLALLVCGVVQWRRADALPALRTLLEQPWLDSDPDLVEDIHEAIELLC